MLNPKLDRPVPRYGCYDWTIAVPGRDLAFILLHNIPQRKIGITKAKTLHTMFPACMDTQNRDGCSRDKDTQSATWQQSSVILAPLQTEQGSRCCHFGFCWGWIRPAVCSLRVTVKRCYSSAPQSQAPDILLLKLKYNQSIMPGYGMSGSDNMKPDNALYSNTWSHKLLIDPAPHTGLGHVSALGGWDQRTTNRQQLQRTYINKIYGMKQKV